MREGGSDRRGKITERGRDGGERERAGGGGVNVYHSVTCYTQTIKDNIRSGIYGHGCGATNPMALVVVRAINHWFAYSRLDSLQTAVK